MLVAKETKHKLILCTSLISLATISLIIGKTLANTLILTAYPTTILPYFYFALALFTMASALIFRRYQQRYPKKLALFFKVTLLVSLIVFGVALRHGGAIIPFFVAIVLLIYVSIAALIAWNYASDIFDLQQYKQYSKVFQLSSTLGAIVAGTIIGLISSQFNPTVLLALLFAVELVSVFFVIPLSKWVFIPIQPKSQLGLKNTIKRNAIFKYLALMTIASMIIGTLIDYNLKLELVAQFDKPQIARVLSIIFVITTTTVLFMQLFCIDYLFKILGSKKIIIIYPIAILVVALATLIDLNFIFIAVLFIANDVFNATTQNLSKNLYFNIMPRSVRILERLKLNGIINPVAIILASLIVLAITYVAHKTLLSTIIIISLCLYSIFLGKVLMERYRIQLIQSLYLRRFNAELINMTNMDNQEIEFILKQALSYPDTSAQLVGLELLSKNNSLSLPPVLADLLTGDNQDLIYEIAKILGQRRDNRNFVSAATTAFLKTNNEKTQWFLALYLMESKANEFSMQTTRFLRKKAGVYWAITSLIYIQKGNLEQQIKGMSNVLKMFRSPDPEQMKWFLFILQELHLRRKEKYLIPFIKQDNVVLQRLAIQQIPRDASPYLINSLISLLGKKNLLHPVTLSLVKIGDPAISCIQNKYFETLAYPIKTSCIAILSLIPGAQAEVSIMALLTETKDMVLKTIIAKYIAYRGVKNKISTALEEFLIDVIKAEVNFYNYLATRDDFAANVLINEEIKSRLQFIKQRVLYYTTAIIGSTDILNSSALLTTYNTDVNQRSLALELIDSTIENRNIAELLSGLYSEKKLKGLQSKFVIDDPWLNNYITLVEENDMDSIYMLTKLRKVALFKNLAAETLQVLASCCSSQDMLTGEVIFHEGDAGDGLYIIDSGEITVTRNGVTISKLAEYDYFGELALLADIPRFATTTASSDGVLFYIDKQDFDRISDEIPEIMKSINKQVIKYLTDNVNLTTE